jgi:hypothetical protein
MNFIFYKPYSYKKYNSFLIFTPSSNYSFVPILSLSVPLISSLRTKFGTMDTTQIDAVKIFTASIKYFPYIKPTVHHQILQAHVPASHRYGVIEGVNSSNDPQAHFSLSGFPPST